MIEEKENLKVRSKLVKIPMTKTKPLMVPQEVLCIIANRWKVEKQKSTIDVGTTR